MSDMANWRDVFDAQLNGVIDWCISSVNVAGGEASLTTDKWPWNLAYKIHSDAASLIIYKTAKLLNEYQSVFERSMSQDNEYIFRDTLIVKYPGEKTGNWVVNLEGQKE